MRFISRMLGTGNIERKAVPFLLLCLSAKGTIWASAKPATAPLDLGFSITTGCNGCAI